MPYGFYDRAFLSLVLIWTLYLKNKLLRLIKVSRYMTDSKNFEANLFEISVLR